MTNNGDSADLRAENARLVALLESHGIEWRRGGTVDVPLTPSAPSTDQRLRCSVGLFRGRTDVYPVRWESKAGKSGYAPACANEWRAGICEKPRIKCSDCDRRRLMGRRTGRSSTTLPGGTPPASTRCSRRHLQLSGCGLRRCRVARRRQGLSCSPVATWACPSRWKCPARAKARMPGCSFRRTFLRAMHVAWALRYQPHLRPDPATEADLLRPLVSEPGHPAEGWLRQPDRVAAAEAPSREGRSLFVDDALQALPINRRTWHPSSRWRREISSRRSFARTGGIHPLDVTFVADEDSLEPWKPRSSVTQRLAGPMPESVAVTLANLVYSAKAQLPQPLANRLVCLAAFQNPEFYRAQAMRMPVWDKPRVIGCAENFPQHIGLPRGCLDAVQQLFSRARHTLRSAGRTLDGRTTRSCLCGQVAAGPAGRRHGHAEARHRRAVRTDSIRQDRDRRRVDREPWREDARAGPSHRVVQTVEGTVAISPRSWADVIGSIGGGKAEPTGRIDVAAMQSLVGRGQRQGEVSALVENYGHVIVDECHHLSALSFDAILRRVKARYVLGLTATPVRRDGQQPIIFMQCGPIRHIAAKPEGAPQTLEVTPRFLSTAIVAQPDAGIQEVFRTLAVDDARTARIAGEIVDAYLQGRKVLVLTERTEHLAAIGAALSGRVQNLVALQGRLSKKQRAAVLTRWKRWRLTRRESCCPLASWLARDSTTRRSTLWSWRCRSRGRAPSSNTLAACTASTRTRRTCGSWISSIQVIRR